MISCNLSIEAYSSEFNNLSIHVNLNERNVQLTTSYLLGLSSSIQDVMGVIRLTNLEDARKMPCCLKQRILRLGLRRLLTPRAASSTVQ